MRAIKSRKDEDMVAAFKSIYEELKTYGHKPSLLILDNECSRAVTTYIQSNQTEIQLVEPHNHRVNAAEVAIKAVKYHFLAHLATIDPNCPLQIWCKFIRQVQTTLLILRTSRVDNKKSAYEAMYHKKINFNRTPIAPVENKVVAFIAPDNRNSWQPHTVNTWYTGPAPDHYRLLEFSIRGQVA